ncbi:hypothetical protein ACROYT_G027094 [Oculina patagonica]
MDKPQQTAVVQQQPVTGMQQQRVFLLLLDGIVVHRRVTPNLAFELQVSIYTSRTSCFLNMAAKLQSFVHSRVEVSTGLSDVGGLAVGAFDLINRSLSVVSKKSHGLDICE